jgi:hypothetical protein
MVTHEDRFSCEHFARRSCTPQRLHLTPTIVASKDRIRPDDKKLKRLTVHVSLPSQSEFIDSLCTNIPRSRLIRKREWREFRDRKSIEWCEVFMQANLRPDTDEADVDSASMIGHQIQSENATRKKRCQGTVSVTSQLNDDFGSERLRGIRCDWAPNV